MRQDRVVRQVESLAGTKAPAPRAPWHGFCVEDGDNRSAGVQAPWRPDVQRAGAGEFRFRIEGQVTATRITVDTLVEDFFEM